MKGPIGFRVAATVQLGMGGADENSDPVTGGGIVKVWWGHRKSVEFFPI